MRIVDRDIRRILAAPFNPRHYRALAGMIRCSDGFRAFTDTFIRYLLNRGSYPYAIRLNTPTGKIDLNLFSYHDLLTVNEVFFRNDYHCAYDCYVVVDIGSNIGISASYFLTLNKNSYVYLFEPSPVNIPRLKFNLSPFEGRYILQTKAVSLHTGMVSFGIEPTGRYGSISKITGNMIEVPSISINDVLIDVISKHGRIDVLKIDTEGSEEDLVCAIPQNLRKLIRIIFYEANNGRVVCLKRFDETP